MPLQGVFRTTGEELGELADGGFELSGGGLAVGEGGAKAGVEFAGVGEADDFAEVGSVVAAAWEDEDAITGCGDKFGEDGCSFRGGGFSAGGEDARCASGDDGFESRAEVGSFVESAVESDGKRARQFDKFASLLDVDGVIAVEDTEDETVHAARFGELDFGAHLREFGVRVNKIFVAGANHGEDGDLYSGASFAHKVFGRSDAADCEEFAEFDSMGAAPCGGDGGIEGFDRDFKEEISVHEFRSENRTSGAIAPYRGDCFGTAKAVPSLTSGRVEMTS